MVIHLFEYLNISDKHFYLNSTTFRKDLLASIIDNVIVGIAIIRFVLPFIGHIVDVSEKPLFEGGGHQN